MDFPLFHLDLWGNRLLIAVIAVTHVIINHAMAVGAAPLVALLEWWGYRTGDARWDRLAYRLLAVCFIVTTSVGALTGMGIWLSASLVNPNAIGSLIRVFFWAWFTEWIVFVTEVCLILLYFLTWHGWGARNKRQHIALGVGLAVASWCTMAIIVAILGFMMDSGRWPQQPSLISGVLNPIYLPQLLFRTPYAMMLAGVFALFLVPFFTERGSEFRRRAVRFVAGWTLVWTPLCAAGAFAYWQVIPESMVASFPVALATQAFEDWYAAVAQIIGITAAVVVLLALWGLIKPGWLPRPAMVLPFLLAAALLGTFERVREFVRKPAVIGNYMYANGIAKADYPLYREQGLLANATYTSVRQIADSNHTEAGRNLFTIACTRCHTTTGMNGVVKKLTKLYGNKPWDPLVVANYLRTMHNVRPFMPPAPGTDAELAALADYLISLQGRPEHLPGAQESGVQLPPTATQPAAMNGGLKIENGDTVALR